MAYNILIFSSVTYELKAQGVFEMEGIKSKLEKIKKGEALNGCGYGLKISAYDLPKARFALEKEKIKIIQIF